MTSHCEVLADEILADCSQNRQSAKINSPPKFPAIRYSVLHGGGSDGFARLFSENLRGMRENVRVTYPHIVLLALHFASGFKLHPLMPGAHMYTKLDIQNVYVHVLVI